jgi:SAM-dependent methyltransferase
MPAINRVDPFTALGDVYNQAGLANYTLNLAPRLLDLAFELEWTGRSLYDMACGTGQFIEWFAEKSFRVLGVDSSLQMIQAAQNIARAKGSAAEFVSADYRHYTPNSPFELVTCLGGALNYNPTLRDLESAFRQASAVLPSGKLFIFDIYTILGLAQFNGQTRIVFNNNTDLTIIAQDNFNYETLLLNRDYMILRYREGAGWQRSEEAHILRGYPIQAVINLLSKYELSLVRVMTSALNLLEEGQQVERVLMVARKHEG